jgi:hypothetical protein
MGKEINFYRVDKQFTEKDNKKFGMHLINVQLEDRNYVVQILNHAGEKLDYNKNAEELLKLTAFIQNKLEEIK